MTANKPNPMKTDPADTTILEECYWQTPGIVRNARRFAESNRRPPVNIFAAQAWPDDDAFGCGI